MILFDALSIQRELTGDAEMACKYVAAYNARRLIVPFKTALRQSFVIHYGTTLIHNRFPSYYDNYQTRPIARLHTGDMQNCSVLSVRRSTISSKTWGSTGVGSFGVNFTIPPSTVEVIKYLYSKNMSYTIFHQKNIISLNR